MNASEQINHFSNLRNNGNDEWAAMVSRIAKSPNDKDKYTKEEVTTLLNHLHAVFMGNKEVGSWENIKFIPLFDND